MLWKITLWLLLKKLHKLLLVTEKSITHVFCNISVMFHATGFEVWTAHKSSYRDTFYPVSLFVVDAAVLYVVNT